MTQEPLRIVLERADYAGCRPNGDTEYNLIYRASWMTAGMLYQRYIDGPDLMAAVNTFARGLAAMTDRPVVTEWATQDA